VVAEIIGVYVGVDFESRANGGYMGKKFNVVNAVVLSIIWKLRNNVCFQGVQWSKMEMLYERCVGVITN
jgi:hypothetical protein